MRESVILKQYLPIDYPEEPLKIKGPGEVFKIIDKYYPRRIIRPATQFFIEEIFDEMPDNPGN